MPEGDLYSHRGTRAVQRMVEFAPSTGGLALWVRHVDLARDAKAPPIATDGNAVYYGADFERLPLGEQTGLVAHEVLHVALRHLQRLLELRQLLGDVDLRLFNICADAIVNSTLSHLAWLTLPAGAVFLDKLVAVALSDKQSIETALLQWDVEKLYRAIDDRRVGARGGLQKNRHERGAGAGAADGGTGGREAQSLPDSRESADDPQRTATRADGPRAARVRMLGGGSIADLLPGAAPRGAPESEAEQARTWSERLLRGHAGDGVHSMLRTLIADVPRTRTPWEQVLRTQLARGLAPKPSPSWSRPSRSYMANHGRAGAHRLPWTPGMSSLQPSPQLVVIVDVSGSIDDVLLEKFACEIEAITRRQEAALVLIVGDDKVRRVAEFPPGRSGLRAIEFAGGGGTNFTPLLEEADKHRPDIVVVLTDLDGPAHFRPRWPVIWTVPEAHASAVQPFGRKLTLS